MRKKELIVLQNASKTLSTLIIRVEGEVFHSLNKKNRTKLHRRLLSSRMGCSVAPYLGANSLEECPASIFHIQEDLFFYPANGGRPFSELLLPNITHYTESHCKDRNLHI
jgi:hypothetical protein